MSDPPSEICTFCGRPIRPGAVSVGRGETAAHAACADAALADESRWERIAGGHGEPPSTSEPSSAGEPERTGSSGIGPARSGCALSLVALLALAATGILPARPAGRRERGARGAAAHSEG